MSKGVVDVSYTALDECRTRIHVASKDFALEEILKVSQSKTPAEVTPPDLFGKLDGAGDLAAKISATWTAVRVELGSAQRRLENVERALDQVETNLHEAATASGA
ncbi:hypothetical protein ACIA8R_31115 [Nonomuraea sp. NPDC051191]|uniref:hypothetical protein n=1 Tax=Nonomuraea sp. NPDC051191 TaxID=3364372 RepID=UPI00378A07D1